MKNPIIEELKILRDEVKLQSHLLSMDAKDKLEDLEKKVKPLENKIESHIKKFGELNEEFWVGNKQEVDKYVQEYKDLKADFNKSH